MISDLEKWFSLLRRNVPVAILFFILGCTATYGVVYQLVLQSKNAKIEILQTELGHAIDANDQIAKKLKHLKDELGKFNNNNSDSTTRDSNLLNGQEDKYSNTKSNEFKGKNSNVSLEKMELKRKDQSQSTKEQQPKIITNPDNNINAHNHQKGEKVEALLELAEKQLSEKKYTTPRKDNAFETYNKILSIIPNNEKAKNGINIIYSKYISLTNLAIQNNKYNKARTYLNRAKKAKGHEQEVEAIETLIREKELKFLSGLHKKSSQNLNEDIPRSNYKNVTNKKNRKPVDLAYIQKINNISYSSIGLNLTPSDAKEFSEYWIEKHSDISPDVLQEVAHFAYSGSGLNLSSTRARDFVKLWFDSFSDIDFSRFEELYKSAYDSSGLNLSGDAALKYTIQNIRNIK